MRADGTCERSGDLVVKKDLEQWFFRITAYADDLLDAMDGLEWPERVKTMQRNWIGRSEGAQFEMAVAGSAERSRSSRPRPDTVLRHDLRRAGARAPSGRCRSLPRTGARTSTAFVERVRQEPDIERQSTEISLEKRGIFTGAYAVNPFNGKEGARSTWPTTS